MVEALKAHIEGLAAHIERWERVAKIVSEVESELSRALDKFPAAFHSGHEGYAVIREELDELWDAVKADDEPHACREAVQVAAMAVTTDATIWGGTANEYGVYLSVTEL